MCVVFPKYSIVITRLLLFSSSGAILTLPLWFDDNNTVVFVSVAHHAWLEIQCFFTLSLASHAICHLWSISDENFLDWRQRTQNWSHARKENGAIFLGVLAPIVCDVAMLMYVISQRQTSLQRPLENVHFLIGEWWGFDFYKDRFDQKLSELCKQTLVFLLPKIKQAFH